MTHQYIISPQYITKEKINVTILDVIDPAHFVVRETPDLTNASSKAKRFLEAEEAMQKYYASVQPCFFQLPLKDAIIVVLYKEKFYRAKVIRILTLSAGHLFRVYLVDYGVECSIPRENIYEIARDFLFHPFQAVDIKLLGVEPVSLVIDKISVTVSYGPASEWDPSAVIFIKELQKNMCSAFIEVQGYDDLHIYGRLCFCYESSPVKCINEELVSKSFAHFNEDCWKKIKNIESILGDSEITSNIVTVQSSKSENVNLEQVPCTANLSNTEIDNVDFKMMFINPIDGKIVAESSFTENDDEKLSVDEDSELRTESCPTKEVIPDLHKVENKSPSHNVETEAQLLAKKHFQKLLNKKKLKSPIKPSSADDTNNKDLQKTSGNETIKNSTIPCENLHISSNEVLPPENIANSKIVNYSIKKGEEDLKNSSFNGIDHSSSDQSAQNSESDVSRTSNQSKLVNSCASDLHSSKSESESVSQAQLIAEKRLMKLQQLKRKSTSPSSATSKNVSALKTSASEKNISLNLSIDRVEADKTKVDQDNFSNKIEISNNRLNNLPEDSCKDQSSNKSIQETPKSSPREESESVVMSENLKQLQRLQKKVRLKQQRESLQVIEKPSKFNQFEELSVNTSCDSSLCDSDSGLNSFSSSPSISDRIEQ